MTSPTPDGREQRKFSRLKSERLVKFMKTDGSEIKHISHIVNISQGGMQFTSHAPLDVDSVLQLHINGTHDQIPISLSGRIVWISEEPDDRGMYYSGVSFLNLTEDARSVILKEAV